VEGRMNMRIKKMEDGRWKMENGKWKMENGRWKMGEMVFRK